jgi:hypothetical protein
VKDKINEGAGRQGTDFKKSVPFLFQNFVETGRK